VSDSAKLVTGLVLLVIGAAALGYAIGSDGAPDKADAATARTEAQASATESARKGAYDAALAKGKAAGEAAGADAGRAAGGADGAADGDAALAKERRKREQAQGGCLPFQAFIPNVGCFPPLTPGDIPDPGGSPDDGGPGPGNSDSAPGHQGD
jgi:hypothetical protein